MYPCEHDNDVKLFLKTNTKESFFTSLFRTILLLRLVSINNYLREFTKYSNLPFSVRILKLLLCFDYASSIFIFQFDIFLL